MGLLLLLEPGRPPRPAALSAPPTPEAIESWIGSPAATVPDLFAVEGEPAVMFAGAIGAGAGRPTNLDAVRIWRSNVPPERAHPIPVIAGTAVLLVGADVTAPATRAGTGAP